MTQVVWLTSHQMEKTPVLRKAKRGQGVPLHWRVKVWIMAVCVCLCHQTVTLEREPWKPGATDNWFIHRASVMSPCNTTGLCCPYKLRHLCWGWPVVVSAVTVTDRSVWGGAEWLADRMVLTSTSTTLLTSCMELELFSSQARRTLFTSRCLHHGWDLSARQWRQ